MYLVYDGNFVVVKQEEPLVRPSSKIGQPDLMRCPIVVLHRQPVGDNIQPIPLRYFSVVDRLGLGA